MEMNNKDFLLGVLLGVVVVFVLLILFKVASCGHRDGYFANHHKYGNKFHYEKEYRDYGKDKEYKFDDYNDEVKEVKYKEIEGSKRY